ncbi:MAG: hypothetical protein J6R59_00245 [Paludibacteraceae bacterium]|nr:hypothetical protein [Paludibacteraceae bacterium]
MGEINKAILVLFKDYKELREWGNDYLLPIARRDDYSQYFDCWSDTHYKLGLMERSTTIGYYADDVYFVNCSIDDCKDEEFFRDLQVMKKWGTKVHYDPKDTEELQSKLKMIDAKWKLYKYCASGELRQYSYEVAMQKLNEEFGLKRDERMMEFCKELLEKYENGTLEEFLKI